MRFVYNDPYALRNAVEQLAGQQPIGTWRERVAHTIKVEVGKGRSK